MQKDSQATTEVQLQADAETSPWQHKDLAKIAGVMIGSLARIDDTGALLVDYRSNPAGFLLPAQSLVSATANDIGREVVLMFEEGDPERPVVMGFVHTGKDVTPQTEPGGKNSLVNVRVDGETITVTGNKEIVLRCGKASITLTRAGKILLRGTYVLSRSSGVNRIKGGSVQIN